MISKRFLTTVLVLVTLLCTPQLKAQTIHAIICGGTNIPDIGEGCRASVALMNEALDVIHEQAEMKLQVYSLVGAKFNKSGILNTINSINPGPDDVILFYSTSHGFNYNDNISKYSFIMAHPTNPEGSSQLDKYGLSLEKEIYNVLANKGARFTLVMAEACNNIIDVPSPTRYKAMTLTVKQNIKSLFRESEGSAIVCSSELGQYSYIDLDNGGFFTNMFMESLNDAVIATQKADWQRVLDLTVQKTEGYADNRSKQQKPTYNIIDTPVKYPYADDKKEKQKSSSYFKSNLKSKN